MRNKSVITCLIASSLLLASLASAQSIDAGRGGLPLTVPASYSDSDPAPLLVLLHGYGSSGARQDAYMRFSALAEQYGYLFIAPDGRQEAGGSNNRFWNASKACCDFFAAGEDDAAYIMSIINQIRERFSIDPDRIYLVGHSNGGFMSYHIAQQYPDTIAAIASLAGAEAAEPRPEPRSPVHILQIHGTEDGTIAYDGDSIAGNRYPGATETVERWATYNGCARSGLEVARLDLERELPGLDTRVVRYDSDCQPGGSSELWTIEGGSHIPAISDSFSTNVVQWLFAHPKVRSASTNAAD
ncbi:MAG: alpha/beta fold hydrolase [Gammaproteobacteria bacterium]